MKATSLVQFEVSDAVSSLVNPDTQEPYMVSIGDPCILIPELGTKDTTQGPLVFIYHPKSEYGFWVLRKYLQMQENPS